MRTALKRLARWLENDQAAACDALSRAFLIHDAPEFCLHDLTTALKRMPELAGYKRIERMHMERLALALRVPYVWLDGRTAAELGFQESQALKRWMRACRPWRSGPQ